MNNDNDLSLHDQMPGWLCLVVLPGRGLGGGVKSIVILIIDFEIF